VILLHFARLREVCEEPPIYPGSKNFDASNPSFDKKKRQLSVKAL
jgi:hypothetical protein